MVQTLAALVFVFFLGGCATLPKPGARVSGEMPVQELCRKYNMDCTWDGVGQTVTMVWQGRRIQVMAGSTVVLSGKERLTLGAPPAVRRGVLVLPPDFETVVFGPAPVPQDDIGRGLRPGFPRLVIVDAGHGGKDTGAMGLDGLREKDIVLDIARHVRDLLEARGVRVVMTRDTDQFISLQDRTVAACRPEADLFLSIHANANKSRRARGVEVYYAGLLSRDDLAESQRQENARKLRTHFRMNADVPELREIVDDMMYVCKLSLSSAVAEAVSHGICRETDSENRGSKKERFYVLRNTVVPSILVEVGFVSNPGEAARLRRASYRRQLAEAIVSGMMRGIRASGW